MGHSGVRKRLKVSWLSSTMESDRHAFRRITKGEKITERSLCGLPLMAGMTNSEKPKCRTCDSAMSRGARA